MSSTATEPGIVITYDPYGIGAAGDRDLAGAATYWVARREVERALTEGRSLRVRVLNRGMERYFDDLKGDPRVVLQALVFSPRNSYIVVLQRLFGRLDPLEGRPMLVPVP